MPTFKIEQVALCPADAGAALELLEAMGLTDWVGDHVVAEGAVFGVHTTNEANLHFNYQGLDGAGELEVLNYTKGANWMAASRGPRVSHIGMHCTESELLDWRRFFHARNIGVAQEVFTVSHTNPHIAGNRTYHYTIFDTHPILGVDVKFIVRRDRDASDL